MLHNRVTLIMCDLQCKTVSKITFQIKEASHKEGLTNTRLKKGIRVNNQYSNNNFRQPRSLMTLSRNWEK